MDKIHPNYYAPIVVEKRLVCDPLDFIRQCRFSMGSALKYLWRAGKKPGESEADDLRKASFYLSDCAKHDVNASICMYAFDRKLEELEVLLAENAFWRALFKGDASSDIRIATTQIMISERLKELE